MTWAFLPEPSARERPFSEEIELAKLEALRAIASQLELIRSDVLRLEAAGALRSRVPGGVAAAREELLNVLNLLEAEVLAHTPMQTREQLLDALARARRLAGAELS